MAINENGFHMLTGPSTDSVRRQIAQQVDIPLHEVALDEVEAYYDFGGYMLPWDPVRKKFEGTGDKNEKTENSQQLSQRAEVLFDRETMYLSYGVFAESYINALQFHKEVNDNQVGPHNALLLGALTTDTMYEFGGIVRAVYSNARCHVIDLEGNKTAQVSQEIAKFYKADALALPFSNNSMDSIHTNYLLNHLRNTEEGRNTDATRILTQEAHRVLRPGGVVVMIEDEGKSSLTATHLHHTDFSDLEVAPAKVFVKRKHVDQFMRSTAIRPLQDRTDSVAQINVITAIKK